MLAGSESDDAPTAAVARSLFALIDEGAAVCDLRGRIHHANPAFCRITGYAAEELRGIPIRQLRSSRHDARFYAQAVRRALADGAWRSNVWCQRRRGQSFPASLKLSAVRDAGGRVSHFLVLLADPAQLSDHHVQLEHMAHHDVLTGLPNRVLLLSRLQAALARSRRLRQLGAVLFVDLDLFKGVNDALGHHAGDEVLREVARRLVHRLRECDLAARYGGDEFVVLLEDLRSEDDAAQVADHLIALLCQPVTLPDGSRCEIGASIGIASFRGEALGAGAIIERADRALFEAKRDGRRRYRIHAR